MNHINSGHYLELMDRLHIINCTLEDHLLDHPITNTYSEVKELIEEAQSKLLTAYQIVGSLS
jgi:hypothetical protein